MKTEIEKINFFLKHKKLFNKHLSKKDYKISRLRWELNKNSEEIAKELNLKTQYVFILLLKSNTIIENEIQNSNWLLPKRIQFIKAE
jgi:hypothetical protein